MRNKTNLFVSILFLIGLTNISTSQEIQTIETQPGRIIAPAIPKATTPGESTVGSQQAAVKVVDQLIKEYKKTKAYMDEGTRMKIADAEARKRIDVLLNKSPGATVSVVILASSPVNLRDTPEDKGFSKNYIISDGVVGNNLQEAISRYLGDTEPTLRAAKTPGNHRESTVYPVKVLIGSKDQNGKSDVRTIGKSEQEKYFEEKRNREAEEAQKTAAEAKKQREDAEIKAKAEKTAQAEKNLKQQQEAEAKAKREAEERQRSREQFASLREKRDAACKSNDAQACIIADDKLTNEFDKARKNGQTALCVKEPASVSVSNCCISCNIQKNAGAFLQHQNNIDEQIKRFKINFPVSANEAIKAVNNIPTIGN